MAYAARADEVRCLLRIDFYHARMISFHASARTAFLRLWRALRSVSPIGGDLRPAAASQILPTEDAELKRPGAHPCDRFENRIRPSPSQYVFQPSQIIPEIEFENDSKRSYLKM